MTRPAVGTWRTIGRGSRIFVPAVLGYALVQYLLVLPNATPAPTPLFLGLVAIAYVFDVLVVTAVLVEASAQARRMRFLDVLRPRTARRAVELIGWAALWIALISLAGVVSAILAAIVVLAGAAVLPNTVADRGIRSWLRPLRRVPVRTLLWGVVAYVLVVISAAVDGELGFLLGEPFATATSRIVHGAINVYILCSATVLAEEAESRHPERARGERIAA